MLLAFSLPLHQAEAQALAIHQSAPVATAPAPEAGAKPAASAIIPGSPLAALTAAAAPPAPADTDADTPTPFGTDSLGLSIVTQVAGEASTTVNEFLQAIQRSTRLTPVLQWLKSFAVDSNRRQHGAEGAIGLLVSLIPALLIEAVVKFGLARPRAALIRYALAQRVREMAPEPDGLVKAESGETETLPRKQLSLLGWLRRLGLALVYICLALLPILAFAITVAAVLGFGLITTKPAHSIVVGASNAYIFCRFVAEALRFVYAPSAPDLRLIHTTDKRAIWMVKSVSVIVNTVAAGIFLISSAEILGLSHDGALVLGLLVALAAHIEVAVVIWQSRRIVAGWIRGKPNDARIAFGIRPRLAGIWHYIALFYVLALWIAYAGGIQNAFGVLLRIVIVFIAAMVLARLFWFGLATLLDRALDDSDGISRAYPNLRARIRAYNNLLKLTIRIFIFGLVLVFMVQGWGFNIIPWLLKDPLSRSLLHAFLAIVITVALALLLWEISNSYLNGRIERLTAKGKSRQALRLRTVLPILKATVGVTIGLVAGLICLSKIGVNAAPLLAGAGVVGIAIGFGSQKLVQDIITGLFLLLEDAMQVGDVITLAGMSGTVERLSIRTIRLRGGDGSINIIPFSAVTTVTNQTRDFGYAQISLNIGYNEDIDRVSAVLMDIAAAMRAEPAWGAMMRDDLQLFGLDSFGTNALNIIGQIRTGPGQHWAVRREFYRRVLKRFAEEKIEIPYASNTSTLMLDPAEFAQMMALSRPPATDSHPPAPGGAPGGASPA
jgi:small conductance mechanosensitive channel